MGNSTLRTETDCCMEPSFVPCQVKIRFLSWTSFNGFARHLDQDFQGNAKSKHGPKDSIDQISGLHEYQSIIPSRLPSKAAGTILLLRQRQSRQMGRAPAAIGIQHFRGCVFPQYTDLCVHCFIPGIPGRTSNQKTAEPLTAIWPRGWSKSVRFSSSCGRFWFFL